MKTLSSAVLFSMFSITSTAIASYTLPIDGDFAKSVTPELIGASSAINRSVRVTYISATDRTIDILVRVGAVDTTKNEHSSNMIDHDVPSYTKKNIENRYCAPFGGGNIHFDQFRQRNVVLNYDFESGSSTPLFSFSIKPSDCSI